MGRYTIELRYLNEPPYHKLFDFQYDFYDNDLKEQFEKKFIDYFYMREIEHDTPELFKHELKTKLNIIAPYYKQLYNTELQAKKIDFLLNKDLKETFVRELTGNMKNESTYDTTNVSNSSVNTLSINNDTPQNKIDDLDKYMTSASKDSNLADSTSNDKGSNISKNTNNSREETTFISQGNIGVTSSAQLLQAWRETLINIDQLILEECEELFFSLF